MAGEELDLMIASSRGSYPVRFVRGAPVEAGAREFVVADRALAEGLLGDSALEGVHGLPAEALLVAAGEKLKTLSQVGHLGEKLLDRGLRRGDRLVAVGGATVSDAVGFLAGTLLRGVPWRVVPTTLLAQADACIGGKTSINLGPRKNAMGTLTPPDEVLVDVSWLRTLDDEQWRSGLAEVVKAHALDGPEAFNSVASALSRLRTDEDALERAVHRALRVKESLVEADEADVGVRRLLNFGHTFGHAIESVSQFAVAHGIAVALGMRIANRLAVIKRLLDEEDEGRMAFALDALSFDVPRLPAAAVVRALAGDKKRVGDGHRFIVLTRGCVAAEIRVADEDPDVERAVEQVFVDRARRADQTRR